MAKEKKQKEAPVNEHPNKIGVKDAAGYTIAEAANMFNLTYISSYLKMFMTDVLGIAPAKAGIMFMITRIWDCINDPLWGALVAKRAPSKDGKFRPYLKWVAFPLGISTILCFLPYHQFTQSQGLLLGICYITYCLYGMMYTGMNIPFGSLASVITDDPNGRNLLSTFRSIGSGVGGAVVSLLAPFFIYSAKMENGTAVIDKVTNEVVKVTDGNKMFIFGLVMGILSIVFYLVGFKTTKERVPSEAEPKMDFKKTYLGLLKSDKNFEGQRVQEVSDITRNLKLMAKDLNIPVVACSQLARVTEGRGKSHKPMLSDLRDSGSIEQDADIVLMLYRPFYYINEKDGPLSEEDLAKKNEAELIIAKNRHGPLETVPLHWNGAFTLFSNAEKTRNEP